MKAKKPMTIKVDQGVVHAVDKVSRLLTPRGRLYYLVCGMKYQLYWQTPRRRNVTCIDCIAAGSP